MSRLEQQRITIDIGIDDPVNQRSAKLVRETRRKDSPPLSKKEERSQRKKGKITKSQGVNGNLATAETLSETLLPQEWILLLPKNDLELGHPETTPLITHRDLCE